MSSFAAAQDLRPNQRILPLRASGLRLTPRMMTGPNVLVKLHQKIHKNPYVYRYRLLWSCMLHRGTDRNKPRPLSNVALDNECAAQRLHTLLH
jgi:hypothetical protein